MQPPLSFANALNQLKILTSQTTNFTFNADELTAALTQAWQDGYVVNIVWDTSITYDNVNFQFTLPGTFSVIRDIYIKKTSDQFPTKLDSSLYEVVNGVLTFNHKVQDYLNDIYTLQIKGAYKLTVNDSLPSDNMINYVLANAAYILLKQLIYKRLFVFLKNDTTIRDMIEARNDLRADMLMYKRFLLREFESM